MIPLFKPYMPELPEMNNILHSGHLAYGQYAKKFEEKLREYFAAPYIMTTNSFDVSIQMVLTALGINENDEIAASPMGCLASTQPYVAYGARMKWIDIDPHRGTLDPNSLRSRITSKTKCIVHNHFCGYPGYINEINEIGAEYGIPVIDDGIECFGSRYKNIKVGNCGTDVTVFSFNPVRLPNTVQGAAIIFKNRNLYEKTLLIRDCGIDRTKFRDEQGEININCDVSEQGYSATMSEPEGYIGFQEMPSIDKLFEIQRKNAKIWDEYIAQNEKFHLMDRRDISPNYWVYGLLAQDKKGAIDYFRKMGYYASGVHTDNSIYSIFNNHDILPGVNEFNKKFVAVPSGWWVNMDETDILERTR